MWCYTKGYCGLKMPFIFIFVFICRGLEFGAGAVQLLNCNGQNLQ